MTNLTISIRFGAALAACTVAFASWAQTLEAPPAPETGDKWTYRFHNKGDKRDPYLYSSKVNFIDGTSAWLHGESQEVNAPLPKYVWRFDLLRADFVDRFEFDPAASNGIGRRTISRESNSAMVAFPVSVGKKYKVKLNWDNGRGFDELDAEVLAFEKVKVEAGEFDAYRIRYTGFWNQREGGNFTGRTERFVWYAPAVKGFIKSTYTNRTNNGAAWNDMTTELVKWEPAASK